MKNKFKKFLTSYTPHCILLVSKENSSTKGTKMNNEVLKTRAKNIEAETAKSLTAHRNFLEAMKELATSPLLDKFDGKVLNARFENQINNSLTKGITLRTSVTGTTKVMFRCPDTMKWMDETLVYNSMLTYGGGVAETRAYDKETNLMTKVVYLINNTTDKRIIIEDYKTLFNGVCDMYEKHIEEREAFSDYETILSALKKKQELEEEKKRIEDEIYNTVPHFVSHLS